MSEKHTKTPIDQDYLVSLYVAAQMVPFPVTERTLVRWASVGLRDPLGNVVKLKRQSVGGHRLTNLRWINEFLLALNPPPNPRPTS